MAAEPQFEIVLQAVTPVLPEEWQRARPGAAEPREVGAIKLAQERMFGVGAKLGRAAAEMLADPSRRLCQVVWHPARPGSKSPFWQLRFETPSGVRSLPLSPAAAEAIAEGEVPARAELRRELQTLAQTDGLETGGAA